MNLTELLLKSPLTFHEITEDEKQKLKKTFMDMLKDIQVACESENVTYMLGGGSCLGAIRHKGFIPWDDDLDLMMLREDYDKFADALNKHFPNKYNLVGPGFSEEYNLPFLKIEKKGTYIKTLYELDDEFPAIAIDVFPFENIPDNKILRFIHGFWNNFYQYVGVCVKLWKRRECQVTKLLLSTEEGKKSLRFRFFIGKLFSFRTYKKWYEKADCIASKYKSKDTDFVAVPTGRKHYFGEIHKKSLIVPTIDCEFEGIKSKISNGYDKYLTALYGNYMQLPPVEKREKHFIVDINFGEE